MNIKKLLFGPAPEERTPKMVKVRNSKFTIKKEKTEYNLSYPETRKVSIFEAEKPNRKLKVIDPTTKLIGEKPEVSFADLTNYKVKTPQIETIIGFETDMIVGNDLIVNADDEEAKKELERLAVDISLYDKIRNHTNTSLTCGFGLLYRVTGQGGLQNVEEFDISTITETYRDDFGNIQSFTQDLGTYKRQNVPFTQEYLQLIFKKNGRSAYGLSEFHGLAVQRNVGNRVTRPLIEALWSLDDVVIGTLENFAYPVEYHVYEGANQDDLEVEAKKLKDQKPGDRFVISRPHVIDRREPTQARFDSFIAHFKDILQQGVGFPIDMLSGDFTSRASSETADSFFMRKIKSYQKYLVKLIKKEIFEYHLMLLGWDEERIKKANVTVEFEVDSQPQYTPEIVGSRVTTGIWTKAEGREYDKGNGQDLFDDAKIEQEETENKQIDMDLKKKQLEEPKKPFQNKFSKESFGYEEVKKILDGRH